MPRSWCRALLPILALIPGMAGNAGAAALEWSGTLTMNLADFGPASITGTSAAIVNGSGGGAHLSSIFLKNDYRNLSPAFDGMTTVPVTDPETTEDNGIVAVRMTITDLGPGTLGGISGGGSLSQDQLAVGGLVRLCLINPDCSSNLSTNLIDHTMGSMTGKVGVGGVLTIGGTGSIRVTIEANPWTLGQASAIDQTDGLAYVTVFSTGFAHGPLSLTSSTALTDGVVKFVTPMQVTTNLTAGSAKKMSLFLSMTLHFLPEPGLLLLLGSGVAGLLLLGRQRIRR